MKPFEKCPVCGGQLKQKQVEKLLNGGGHSIAVNVIADVCLQCGERIYSEDVIRTFEEMRNKLKKQDFDHLINTGQSFTVEENWPNEAVQPVK